MDSTATQQCSLFPNDYAVYSQFCVFITQKMQLTGWENATDKMRNTTFVDTQISNQ